MIGDPVLAGRRAIVLGASRGIGRAVALALAAAGATVVVVARSNGDARFGGSVETTVAEALAAGGSATGAHCDLSDAAEIDRLLEGTVRSHGGLDAIVNCAAHFSYAPLAELSAEEWDETFSVNARGPFLLTRAAIGLMAAGGHIVHFTGSGAHVAAHARVATGASKAALERLVAGAALESGSTGVGVSLFDPGVVKSERAATLRPETDWSGVPEPPEIATAVLGVLRREPAAASGRRFVFDRAFPDHVRTAPLSSPDAGDPGRMLPKQALE